ncbi:TOBE domain-containing protein [Streptomyces palmae]|uniref:Adenylate kinase n=1 Tax=Streptomyces palmae TaxID=1701085 RepID=A0A4Z0GQ78_9ACTN|nr:TOBE domain-containing protein [Streptomyces palmae]TGA99383.1 adenylate kinase [Streptomyces palmae]
MNLSIRNQLPGAVLEITHGEAMSTVRVTLRGGQEITAAVTRAAVEDLGLAPGQSVTALVKSTEVALATGPLSGVSIRNQLPGTVSAITSGAAMATVEVAITGGELTAAITQAAVADLGLAPGSPVVALVKSTEVSLLAG